MTLPCILCDLHDERGDWFGPAHAREYWSQVDWRPWLAGVHGLVLAEGGTLRDGPWIPLRDEVRVDE